MTHKDSPFIRLVKLPMVIGHFWMLLTISENLALTWTCKFYKVKFSSIDWELKAPPRRRPPPLSLNLFIGVDEDSICSLNVSAGCSNTVLEEFSTVLQCPKGEILFSPAKPPAKKIKSRLSTGNCKLQGLQGIYIRFTAKPCSLMDRGTPRS